MSAMSLEYILSVSNISKRMCCRLLLVGGDGSAAGVVPSELSGGEGTGTVTDEDMVALANPSDPLLARV